MQEKINRFIWLIIPILLIGAIFLYFKEQKKIKEYTSNLFYMDTYIYIKLYETDSKKAKEALTQIETMYADYHKLSDRYQAYDGITNIYTILHNQETSPTLTLDTRLYKLLQYAKEGYQLSNGLVDVTMGKVLDIWKTYREKKTGIPLFEELQTANTASIDDLILLENNQIQNNRVALDLGAIAKGYTTELVAEYLESIGIDSYLINAGGNVKVGTAQKDNFKIGLEDPNSKEGDVFKVIYGNNISVVTSGGYERYYEYEGIKYHHIIDPHTLFPTNYMKSVTVICEDSKQGDLLSTMLFLMPIDQGKELVETIDGVEAIWYGNDNNIITSTGISRYEQK